MFVIGKHFPSDAADNLLEKVTGEPRGMVMDASFLNEITTIVESVNNSPTRRGGSAP
jgi:hypothetical protein